MTASRRPLHRLHRLWMAVTTNRIVTIYVAIIVTITLAFVMEAR